VWSTTSLVLQVMALNWVEIIVRQFVVATLSVVEDIFVKYFAHFDLLE